jgi:acetoin:2,6-dichlorophenolindophenol oxidoreductase subunit beta
MRELTYADAIAEALVQGMERDPNVFVCGIGVDDHKGIFGTTRSAFERFGAARVFDVPIAEQALTGVAIGAALMGKRPVVVHARNDFMFLATDQMINLAAKTRYMYGGRLRAPIVVRSIVGKGWGQGATHSQSLQALFGHFPGLQVVMPALPRDAKGLTLAALRSEGPVVILEHRTLYSMKGPVPEAPEITPIGTAAVVREGRDVTVVATSLMVVEAMRAAERLATLGVEVEVVDCRSIRPFDRDSVLTSLAKTGRVVVADTSWVSFGVASEVASVCADEGFRHLRAPVRRIGLADCPAPVSLSLERAFYPDFRTITRECLAVLDRDPELRELESVEDSAFTGPY